MSESSDGVALPLSLIIVGPRLRGGLGALIRAIFLLRNLLSGYSLIIRLNTAYRTRDFAKQQVVVYLKN